MHRGLVNYSGELWYREGLPSDVFRRLVVRKENETPLDRFSGDYEELMTYANFRDLADIIVGNEVLKDRLTILEPRDGASLLDRLLELEEMRRSVSSSNPVCAEDTERLQRYFDEFRTAIKRGRSPAKAAPPAVAEVEAPPDEETLESIFEEEAPSPPAKKSRPGRLVVKVSSDGLRQPAPEPVPDDEELADEPAPTPVTSEVGSMDTPVTHVSVRPGPREPVLKGPIEEAEVVERALRDDDEAVILKALHVEVTEIADGMLRREPKHGHMVWGQVRSRGWYDSHLTEFELEPLERFYELADGFLESYSSGAKSSELKSILAEAGFSKLLLEMREMFLACRAKA